MTSTIAIIHEDTSKTPIRVLAKALGFDYMKSKPKTKTATMKPCNVYKIITTIRAQAYESCKSKLSGSFVINVRHAINGVT